MRKLFFLFLTLVATTSLWAQTFQVGDLYYNITSSSAPYTVEVTYERYQSSSNYSSLTTAIIPETVTYNGTTYSVTSIGEEAFYYCSSLTSVTIPNSVTSIGYLAFWWCTPLTSITCLGTTPPTLGTNVFYGTKLSAVYIPDNTLSAYQTAWGNEYAYVNKETTLTLHVATPGTLSDLIFDAGTRPVLVAKLTLTGTLNDADFTCMRETMTSLVDVDLSGITNTSGVNFNGKARLVRIILPTNLTSIGDEAFEYCSSLTSITIHNSVTSIGDKAFFWCTSLTFITIPNSVTSIGYWAFYDCENLTSVTIPNSVTSIGDGAFHGCSSLTSITIGNSVTSIGDDAFAWCSSLTSVTIPNSVTSIGNSAFESCSSLTSITCLGTTPPDASDLGAPTTTCTLIVPRSAYNAYLRHAYWGQFLNIVPSSEMESSAPEVYINPANPAQKLLRNGQLIILRDGVEYNAMGQEL